MYLNIYLILGIFMVIGLLRDHYAKGFDIKLSDFIVSVVFSIFWPITTFILVLHCVMEKINQDPILIKHKKMSKTC